MTDDERAAWWEDLAALEARAPLSLGYGYSSPVAKLKADSDLAWAMVDVLAEAVAMYCWDTKNNVKNWAESVVKRNTLWHTKRDEFSKAAKCDNQCVTPCSDLCQGFLNGKRVGGCEHHGR